MISRIEAYKYRCFEKLDVGFNNFRVLVGANGAGKSTLLDIVTLLSDMVRFRRVDAAFFEKTPNHPRARAELAEDLIFNQQGDFFAVVVEVGLPDAVVSSLTERLSSRMSPARAEQYRRRPEAWPGILRYELQCEKLNDQIQVSQEYLLALQAGERHRHPHGAGLVGEEPRKLPRTCIPILVRQRGEPAVFSPEAQTKRMQFQFRFEPAELALANVPSDQDHFAAALWFRSFLSHGTCFYQPNAAALRQASPARIRTLTLSSDGSTLPWLIARLKEAQDQRAFKRWLGLVQLALPPIHDVLPFVREDDRAAYFKLVYESNFAVSSPNLSDGTLNILALTILPYLDRLPNLITVEEPENGVHPKAIQAITEALSSVGNAQVWLSSHSPIVLANVKPENVLCLSLSTTGAVTAIPGERHPGLADWKGGVDLGTLFATGVLS